MEAKNGFTILMDYILSMAYFGSCRISPGAGFDSDGSLILKPFDVIPSVASCELFLAMIESCCYFQGVEGQLSFNLGAAANAALESIVSAVRLSSKAPDKSMIDCILLSLQEKVRFERDAHISADSHSQYTETDRIVKMLISNRTKGSMVLLRVYDSDENRSMQIILRHAMEVCKLCVDRKSEGRSLVPAFSVISDVANTKLLHVIEPYFRDEHDVSGSGAGNYLRDIPHQRAQKRLEKKPTSASEQNLDLKYEDLLNVPCLIILCEKGRMGDTFPHTLRTLDLRLRTGGTASCFLQEIGRMCRYPRCDRTSKALSVDDISNIEGVFTSSPHHFGVVVRNAANSSFLGVAHTAADVQRILNELHSGAEVTSVTLSDIAQPLPYALIDPSVAKSIRGSINDREAAMVIDDFVDSNCVRGCGAFRARTEGRLVSFLKMDRGVDDYLTGKMIKSDHNYKLKKVAKKKGESDDSKKKGHYDDSNKEKERDPRRFLLSAECQVGKTGAYLYFLCLLRHYIGQKDSFPASAVPVVGEKWHKWLFPELANLQSQPQLEYDFPKSGKYHHVLAQQRLRQIYEAMSPGAKDGFGERFVASVRDNELTVTTVGNALLDKLKTASAPSLSYHEIMRFLNWDGRFGGGSERWYQGAEALVNSFIMQMNFRGAVLFRSKSAASTMFGSSLRCQVSDDCHDDDAERVNLAASSSSENGSSVLRPVTVHNRVVVAFNQVAHHGDVAKVFTSDVTIHPISRAKFNGAFDSEKWIDVHKDVLMSVPVHAHVPKSQSFKLVTPSRIKKWIFTPSFYDASTSRPEAKLLMRDDAFSVKNADGSYRRLERWVEFGEVLVVRANQFDAYYNCYGNTHIIAVLPDSITVGGITHDCASGGIGFARLYSQLLAHVLDLGAVWMIDDYVLKCWQLVCEDLICAEGNVSLQPATFAEVMLHIEFLIDAAEGAVEDGGSVYPSVERQIAEASQSSGCSLSSIIGGANQYGIIGMCRGRQWRSSVTYPIKRSYSVYSFFLLNVKETVGRGLFFPARPIWEDIEFNNLLDEKGLIVCKLQVFAHEKLVHAPPVELTLCEWLNKTYKLSSNAVVHAMEHMSLHDQLVEVYDMVSGGAERVDGADSLILVHNPSIVKPVNTIRISHRVKPTTLIECVRHVLDSEKSTELMRELVATNTSHTCVMIIADKGITEFSVQSDIEDAPNHTISYTLVDTGVTSAVDDFFVVKVDFVVKSTGNLLCDEVLTPIESPSADINLAQHCIDTSVDTTTAMDINHSDSMGDFTEFDDPPPVEPIDDEGNAADDTAAAAAAACAEPSSSSPVRQNASWTVRQKAYNENNCDGLIKKYDAIMTEVMTEASMCVTYRECKDRLKNRWVDFAPCFDKAFGFISEALHDRSAPFTKRTAFVKNVAKALQTSLLEGHIDELQKCLIGDTTLTGKPTKDRAAMKTALSRVLVFKLGKDGLPAQLNDTDVLNSSGSLSQMGGSGSSTLDLTGPNSATKKTSKRARDESASTARSGSIGKKSKSINLTGSGENTSSVGTLSGDSVQKQAQGGEMRAIVPNDARSIDEAEWSE